MNCRICNCDNLEIYYQGPIRDGGVNGKQIDNKKILYCKKCDFYQLFPIPQNLEDFYETHEYRQKWDTEYNPSDLHKVYDHEQNERIKIIGIQNIRNKKVLDLGASSGVFLDTTIGVARETIAIEPMLLYKEYHLAKGHKYYAYPEEAISDGVKVDIVTCFDVIEHVIDPKLVISNIFNLLGSGGKLFLSMPSFHDLLLSICEDKFAPFFFQTAHLNYFTEKCMQNIFQDSNFSSFEIDYLHKYNIDNLLGWVKHGKPGHASEFNFLNNRNFNDHYKTSIENLGVSSHFFITAFKK